jgi:asparagine synthase (glutamine-hydrolysing)
MCGILGMSIDTRADIDAFEQFSEKFVCTFEESISLLSHRGPDASGSEYFPNEGVFLGHTRLAIQDLRTAGNQPMVSKDKKLAITFNGEIYNFPELKNQLISLGYGFFSKTDTEVIMCLYAEYGIDCFAMLDGIFSLAIFDKTKKSLTVARDGLGVKPLYYFSDSRSFIFSSEIKAIENLVVNECLTLDKCSLNRYLTFQWCPGEGTPFHEIKKQNPGEALVIKNGEIVDRKTFFQLPIVGIRKKDHRVKVKELISVLDVNLRKAVHDQMLSDAPVGAFLSGGLDSTSIVAFAKEIDPKIACFTIDTQDSCNEGMADDLPYARAAAKSLNVPLEVVRVDSDSLIKNLEKMVWLLEEPLGDPAPLNVLYISELAKENGMKVLLSGAGGDDIFSGYRRHQAIMVDKKLQILPKCLLSGLEKLTGKLDKRVTFFRRLAKFFNGSSLVDDGRIVNYFKWIDQGQLSALYTEEFRREMSSDLAEQPMVDFLKLAHPYSTDLDRMLALEQRFFIADHNLLYTDKMSMATGIEVRVPLLAKNLVEFAASIPDNMKQKGSEGKWIFKKTMEPYLPRNIIYRPKTGFGAPLRRWLKVELNDYVADLLSHRSLASRGLFDPERVRRLIASNNAGAIDVSYTIFSLMCVEIWCRQHLDLGPAGDGRSLVGRQGRKVVHEI